MCDLSSAYNLLCGQTLRYVFQLVKFLSQVFTTVFIVGQPDAKQQDSKRSISGYCDWTQLKTRDAILVYFLLIPIHTY